MQGGNFNETTESDSFTIESETNFHLNSIGSIKTQDSIENNSIIINFDEEEYKAIDFHEIKFAENHEATAKLKPFIGLADCKQEINNAMSFPRTKLEIKNLETIFQQILKISAEYQACRKKD